MHSNKKGILGASNNDKTKAMTKKEIGEAIKKELKLQNLSQVELSRRIDRHPTIVNDTINANSKWSYGTLVLILEELNLKVYMALPPKD